MKTNWIECLEKVQLLQTVDSEFIQVSFHKALNQIIPLDNTEKMAYRIAQEFFLVSMTNEARIED